MINMFLIQIIVENITFQSGKIINSQVKGAGTIAIFTCTLGKQFDKWMELYKESGDMLHVYITDIIGSELAELAADRLETKILKESL